MAPGGRLEAFRSVGDGTYLRVTSAGISNLLAVKIEGGAVRTLPQAEAKEIADRLGVRTINARWRLCR